MQVEVFTIADAATEAGGKLNVLGSFDTFFSKQLPIVWPFCTVAVKIRGYRGETNVHKIELNITDPQKRPIVEPFRGDIVINFVSESDFAIAHILMNYQGLQFAQYGQYSIDLSIDGKVNMSIPLLVRKPI